MQPTHSLPVFRRARWGKCAVLGIVLLTILAVPASVSSAGLVLINEKLSGDAQPNGGISMTRLSPDGTRVAFTGDLELDGMNELYSAPARGGPRVRLSGDHLINGGNVASDFSFTPDSQRIIFRADKDVDGIFELWSVPAAGGMPVQLSGILPYE